MPDKILETKMRAYCKNCDYVGTYHRGTNAETEARADGDKHEGNKPGHITGVEVSERRQLS